MRISKSVKAITAKPNTASTTGTYLLLLKVPRGTLPTAVGVRAQCKIYAPGSTVRLYDDKRYDYHAFRISDGPDEELTNYFELTQ